MSISSKKFKFFSAALIAVAMIAFGSCQSGVEAANSNSSSSSGSGSTSPQVSIVSFSRSSVSPTGGNNVKGFSTSVECTVNISNIPAGYYEYYFKYLDENNNEQELSNRPSQSFRPGNNTLTIPASNDFDRTDFRNSGNTFNLPIIFELKEYDDLSQHRGRTIAKSAAVNLTVTR